MANENFIVSSLPDYVHNNREVLLKNFALVGTETRRRIGLQTGVKKDAYLNFLNVAPTLQSGASCGFSAAGDVALTQRTISTAMIKVDLEICPENLIGKWAEYLVRVSATENDLPFEQWIVDGLVAEINKKIEKLIWQGDHTQSSDASIKWIDGFLYIANADADVIDVNIASGVSAYNGLVQVYASIPEESLERGACIFVSPAIFRCFMQDLVGKNYFHYDPRVASPDEVILPGTDVRVVKTPGLAGSLKVLATFPENLVYGCDMEGDAEDIDIWFSQDNRNFRMQAKWNSGVQMAFPGQVVLGVFAAAPSMPAATNADALAAIATNTQTIATKSAGLDNLADIKTNTGTIATKSGTMDTSLGTIATQVTGLNAADKVFKTDEQE